MDTITLSNRIDLKANTSDVTSGLDLKLNKTDTSSLSDRINLKADVIDVNASLALKLNNSSATSMNTTNAIVKRDSSGNFAANIISGTLSGTATNANALLISRNINGVAFDGSSDITVSADAGTLTGTALANNVTGSALTSVGTITNGTWSATLIDVTKGGTGTNNGSITGTAALTFTAGGSNQNISILASGTGSVGVGTSNPTSSAALDVASTTKGFLPPRMTSTQRNAMSNPVAGLTIWNSTNVQLEVYNGSVWVNMDGKTDQTLSIGNYYQGGIVAYIFTSSDIGYVDGQVHGLIAATSDQSTGIRWYKGSNTTTNAQVLGIGGGSANTTTIITQQGQYATTYAAGLARAYTGGGYTDWYLPSRDELNKLYLNQVAIGGFTTGTYWSSSEKSATPAYKQTFDISLSTDYNTSSDKSNTYRVRAVRSF